MNDHDALVPTLARMPFLSALDVSDLEALAASFLEARDHDGHVFFEEGAGADGAYLVLEGTVSATVVRGGETKRLGLLGPGELFGTIALLDNLPRSATCVAVGPTRTARLLPAAFWLLAGQRSGIALVFQQALARQLAHDFRRASRRVHEACAAR